MDQGCCSFDRIVNGGRNKKLIAGIWYSIHISDTGNEPYNCETCKKRESRNCENRKGLKYPVLLKREWADVPLSYHRHEVQKIGPIKYFVCPGRFITGNTWEILRLVNGTTDGECNIINLPFSGSYTDQPSWYHEAVSIVRSARAESQKMKLDKRR